jgi:hypothetical protein
VRKDYHGFDPINDMGIKCQVCTTGPDLIREVGKFGLGAHLRKRGQKPEI